MAKCFGVTEPYWEKLSEDDRLYWRITSRAVGIVGAFFVNKSGNHYLDWTLTALTAAFYLFFVDTQRSYSKLSPVLRKRCIRIAITLGSHGPAALGIALYVQIALASVGQVFATEIAPGVMTSNYMASKIFVVTAFLIATPVAIIRVFRQLQLEQLIYHVPRQVLKRILVHKSMSATSFETFAHIELSVLGACLIYASIFSELASIFIDML